MTEQKANQVHEEKDTLSVDVILPAHPPRKVTIIFARTKRMLMKIADFMGFRIKRPAGRCWICGKTEGELGTPLEAHHFGIERAYIDAEIRWDLVAIDFPIFDWKNFDPAKPEDFVDNMAAQGLLLCKEHHTGKDTGIHDLPLSVWIMQRYLVDGTRFNPNEVISHDKEDFMNSNTAMYLKFAVGFCLFTDWMILTLLPNVHPDPDLIQFIKYVLVGLATHMLTVQGQKAPPSFPSNPPTNP